MLSVRGVSIACGSLVVVGFALSVRACKGEPSLMTINVARDDGANEQTIARLGDVTVIAARATPTASECC